MTNIVSISEKSDLLIPKIDSFSGLKTYSEQDLVHMGVDPHVAKQLHTGTFRSGSATVIDPKHPKAFKSIRGKIYNLCLEAGPQIAGGFLIPKSKTPELIEQIDDLIDEFYDYKAQMLSDYEDGLEEFYASANIPDSVKHILRRNQISRSYLEGQINATYYVLALTPTEHAVNHLEKAVEDLPTRILAKVAEKAEEFYNSTLIEKRTQQEKAMGIQVERDPNQGCTTRARHTIAAIRDKLDSLSYVDPTNFSLVIQQLDSLYHRLPEKGYIRGQDFTDLVWITTLLKNPDTLIDNLKAMNVSASILSGAITQPEEDESPLPEEVEEVVLEDVTEPSVDEPVVQPAVEPSLFDDLPPFEEAVVEPATEMAVKPVEISTAQAWPDDTDEVTPDPVDTVEPVDVVEVLRAQVRIPQALKPTSPAEVAHPVASNDAPVESPCSEVVKAESSVAPRQIKSRMKISW